MAVVQVAVKLGPMRFFEACAQAEIRQLDMTLKHTHTSDETANQRPR